LTKYCPLISNKRIF